MARTGNGSTGSVLFNSAGTNAGLLPNPYSWHFWYRDPNPAGTLPSGQEIPFQIAQADGSAAEFNFGFVWRSSSAGNVKAFFHRINGGTIVTAQLTSALSANTWYSIAGSWDGTNIYAYLNGQLQATTAAGSMAFTAGVATIYGVIGGGFGSFARGTMADFYFVNGTTLTAKQIASLAAGASPALLAQDTNKAMWWTLLGDSPEPNVFQTRNSTGQRNGTVTGTTVTLHPGVQSVLGLP